MIKFLKITFTVFGGIILLFAAIQALSPSNSTGKSAQLAVQAQPSSTPISIEEVPNIDDLPLQDNPNVYQYDDPGSVVTMYVTVRKGNVSDNSDYTWDEVNDFSKYYYTNNQIVVVGVADAIVQIGDENGPLQGELGYGSVVPNATIRIRGATTSLAAQKSYKIELLSGAGTWQGQSTIALNKHPYDDTRVRNKLNFDLLKQISDITSLRTQFVHLYVKDETTDPWDTTFVDYGLFTQVEQPDTRFLRAHLLDPDGQLYKANAFEFFRYPDQIRLVDDPLYDENAFSPILEIKGNTDNSKLIQMLDDVNNYDIPIEQTFAKYFDSDNYFTWLAYNILVGNVDTQTQNFYLYSPHNGNKWYFLPWDYDGAFPLQGDASSDGRFVYASWENGVSNYWGAVLPNRLLRLASYRQDLDDKINTLKTFLTSERIKSTLDVYKKAVDPYVSSMPDLQGLLRTLRARDMEIESIPGDIQTNYDMYLESLKRPMPFYLGTPTVANGTLDFKWEEAYDFNGQDITYDFVVSTDFGFKKIVAEGKLTNVTDFQMTMLAPGIYFWRVTAENTSGKTQVPFDYYVDSNFVNQYGMKYLHITPDGQVLEK